MIYHSVGDIYAANDDVRRRLVARVAELDEAQANQRPNERAWSPAEIVEHLSIIEGNMVRLVAKLLDKIESAASAAPTSPPAMPPFSLDDYEAQIRDQKLTAPEAISPRGLPLDEALARLNASRAAINELRPRVETADGTRAQYPHPFFGPLNLYQWLAFIGLHEARHLRQLEGALETLKAEG
jgi:DinB superfamily